MASRLIVATILMGATLYFSPEATRHGAFTPSFLLVLTSTIYASSILFGVWLLRRSRERPVAASIVAIDVVLITGLVYLTGGVGSVFSFLYGAEILTAALTLGTGATYLTATASLLCYLLLGLTLNIEWLPAPPDQPLRQYVLAPREFSFWLFFNTVGITLVSLLATNLARRVQLTGGRLRAAQQNAARWARLNDDIVRSIASGLITTDDEGRILAINRAAAEILGDEGDSLLNRPLSTVLPGYQAQLEPNGRVNRAEAVGLRADGTQFIMGYTLSALLDAEDHSSGLLLVFQDLTEIKELRERAEQAQRLAVLGRLATGLAHEIRNPLSSISGSVEMVRDGNSLSPEDRQLLGIVVSEVERLNQLVTTMLQAGKPQDIHPEEVDLRLLAREVVAIAHAEATTSNALTIEEHDPGQPVLVHVDPDQMRQLIWNLVKNAIQASPHGGSVGVKTGYTGAGEAFLEVTDQGPGIRAESREKLFEVFYSGRSYGVGLGLAVVKQIVEQHQAQIELVDRPGGGTCFRIVLPSRSAVLTGPQETPRALWPDLGSASAPHR